MKIYNRYSAVSYARNYGHTPNKYFHNYGGDGGDCTNFVSQALWAGGWPMYLSSGFGRSGRLPDWAARMREGAYDDKEHWYNRYGSPAWVGAPDFKRLLKVSGRGSISDRFSMQIGDVAQIVDIDGTVDGDGADHTMLITWTAAPSSSGGIGGANLWLTYHSRNKVDVPLADVEATLDRSVPGKPDQQLVFWKISDIILSPEEQGLMPYGPDYDEVS
jgi:hypothetical protein